MDEFKKANELSEALNTLKIIINYAITTSARPNETILSFIHKIYTDNLAKQSEIILKSRIIEGCSLAHLKLIWIILTMKRSILYTLNDQDPFDKLNSCFKHGKSDRLSLNYDRSVICSVTGIVYQIIMFVLTTLKGDDLQSYNQIRVRDMLESLEDLSSIILYDRNKIPSNFLEDQSEARMDSVYSIWCQLCSLWDGNNY